MEGIKHYQSEERKGIEQEAFGKTNEWIDQDLAVKADVPLVDTATGKKLIVRVFEFAWKTGMKADKVVEAVNNKQFFFNGHAKYIKDFLWKDGLVIREDHDPKMNFDQNGYKIAVLCEARLGLNIFEKGRTLQDVLHKKKKK